MRNEQRTPLRSSLVISLTLALAFLGGCASYNAKTESVDNAYRAGDLQKVATEAAKNAEKNANTKHAILFHLENGSAQRSVGNAQASLEAFAEAEVLVDEFDAGASVRLGGETTGLLVNQGETPYTGRDYDKVFMNTYRALSFLDLGEPDAARVEFNRALERQRDAVAANSKRIEKAAEEAQLAAEGKLEGSKEKYDVEKAQQDPKVAAAVSDVVGSLDARLKEYADYVNPYTVFLDGLFFMHAGYDASDAERARKSIERVASMSPGDKINEDLVRAEAIANGGSADGLTYVIFETGFAPSRDQYRFDLPLFIVGSNVSYTGAAFPKLVFNDDYVPFASVAAGATLYQTELIADVDSIIAKDFKNEWPIVVTKTLTSAALKAIADYAINEAMKDQDWRARLATKLITAAAGSATVGADRRTWKSLPKQVQYTCLPTPEDGIISVSAGAQVANVNVSPSGVNVVVVRCFDPFSPLVVSQFDL